MAREAKLERLSPVLVTFFLAALATENGRQMESFSFCTPVAGRPRLLGSAVVALLMAFLLRNQMRK